MLRSMLQRQGASPRTRRPLLRLVARAIYRISGWRAEGKAPTVAHCIIVAAPHTSYWDGLFMLLASFLLDVKLSWFVKDSLFFWPLGPFLRWLGGIPIDRSSRRNMVKHMAERFAQAQSLYVAIPPEGTRAFRPHWRTGFYRIAEQAQIPLVFGYVDFSRKVSGLGPEFLPTGDIDADFRVFADFYKNIGARHPHRVGPIRPPK